MSAARRLLGGRYELLEELGRGGMASVHRAHDQVLNRDVALKIIRLADTSSDFAERFVREAQVVAQLDHPNIVPVYDFHQDGTAMFYVMPVVDGLTLEDVLSDGPLDLSGLAPLVEQVAAALAYSHVRGVVHRDVKPGNVLLAQGDDGEQLVRLTDFGIALMRDQHRITAAGMIVGTPGYLSPEQVASGQVDHRSDIYMLGALAYECITGELPIDGTGFLTLRRVLTQVPRPPSHGRPDLPPELDALVMQCLEKDPARRPQSASEVIQRMRTSRLVGQGRRVGPGPRHSRRRRKSDTVPAYRVDSSRWVMGMAAATSEEQAAGDALLVKGDYDAARKAFEADYAARTASDAADESFEGESRLRLANVAHKQGRYDEALAHCHDGLARVGASAPMLSARLSASAGLACTSAGRFDDAAEWISNALEHLDDVGFDDASRPFIEAMIRRTQGNVLIGRGRPVEAIDVYAKSLTLLDPAAHPWEHSIALFNLGEACTLAGQDERAEEHLDAAFTAKAALGDRWGLAYVHAMRAQVHLDRDDLESAAEAAGHGYALARDIDDPKLCAMHATLMARVYLRRGQPDHAADLLEGALEDAASCNAMPEVIEAQVRLAELWLVRGELDLAADAARVALDLSAAAGSRGARGQALLVLGRVDMAAGRTEAAAKRLERAATIAARGGNAYRANEVERARRQLATPPSSRR